MPSCYVRLNPVAWVQEIRHYPSIRANREDVEGRHLRVTCAPDADYDLLLSNKVGFRDLSVALNILEGEPKAANREPLERGIGIFVFSKAQAPRDDIPGRDAFVHGWFYLKLDSYAAVWDQVRDGGYVDCFIDLGIGPVGYETFESTWDVNHSLFIESASLQFTRKPIAHKPADQPDPRRGLFARR
jgi:hypothetical protein